MARSLHTDAGMFSCTVVCRAAALHWTQHNSMGARVTCLLWLTTVFFNWIIINVVNENKRIHEPLLLFRFSVKEDVWEVTVTLRDLCSVVLSNSFLTIFEYSSRAIDLICFYAFLKKKKKKIQCHQYMFFYFLFTRVTVVFFKYLTSQYTIAPEIGIGCNSPQYSTYRVV